MTPLEWLGAILGALVGLLTLAAIIGLIWARVRSSSDETTIALWQGEAEAYKAKSERLEDALIALEKRVAHLESENLMLRQLHDNRQEMAELRAAITEGFAGLALLVREGRL